MTADVRNRAPFELLAFTAAPVAGGLVVIELEGRFAAVPAHNGRFTRRPMLVVEPADDRPRLELAPVRSELHDAYWRGAYAIPAEALNGARFALGVRGTLLELPAPDALEDTQRFTSLAREANSLRRALEAAEAEVATARFDADATSAELDTAVLAARDGALAETAERIATLEAELAARDGALAQSADSTAVLEAELAEVRRMAEQEATAYEQAVARAEVADQRAAEAEARAKVAEKAARAAESGTEVLRAELAEERERSSTPITPPTQIAQVATASAPPHTAASRGPGPWIAVAALVLFAIVLLALLLG